MRVEVVTPEKNFESDSFATRKGKTNVNDPGEEALKRASITPSFQTAFLSLMTNIDFVGKSYLTFPSIIFKHFFNSVTNAPLDLQVVGLIHSTEALITRVAEVSIILQHSYFKL